MKLITTLVLTLFAGNVFALKAFIPDQKTASQDNFVYSSRYKVQFCEDVKYSKCVNEVNAHSLSYELKTKLLESAYQRLESFDEGESQTVRSKKPLSAYLISTFVTEDPNEEQRQDIYLFSEAFEGKSVLYHRSYTGFNSGYSYSASWSEVFHPASNTVFLLRDHVSGYDD